jgi:hypothetical protein
MITFVLLMTLNPPMAEMPQDAKQQQRSNPAKLGYSRGAPIFAQFPAPTKLRGERKWISLGRCDQVSGKAFDRLVQKEAREQGPIFAGHYSIVVCSCGTECGSVSIVDLRSDRIYDFDFISQVCSSELAKYDNDLFFRVDSFLLILIGSPPNLKNGSGRNSGCPIRYYRWTGSRLVLLREKPT